MPKYSHDWMPDPVIRSSYEQAAIADYWWMKELCSWTREDVEIEGYNVIHEMKAFHGIE